MQDNSKSRNLFIAVSVLGVMLILFFGLRAFHAFKKFENHRPPPIAEELRTDAEDIEDWMTVPFVSYNYGVSPDILFDALDIDPKKNFKKSLKQLNDEFYPDEDGYVLATVKATILTHQPQTPPVPPDAPMPAMP